MGSGRLPAATALTIAVIGLAVLSGCTAGPTPTRGPSSTSTTPAAAASGGGAAEKVSVLPGTAKDGFVGAIADAKVTACDAADNHWEAKGTVTNASTSPADYRIYVSFLAPDDTKGNATRAVMQVNVADVGSGAKKDWSNSVAVQGTGLKCVLRVEKVAHK